jgi:hypothetical protein
MKKNLLMKKTKHTLYRDAVKKLTS